MLGNYWYKLKLITERETVILETSSLTVIRLLFFPEVFINLPGERSQFLNTLYNPVDEGRGGSFVLRCGQGKIRMHDGGT